MTKTDPSDFKVSVEDSTAVQDHGSIRIYSSNWGYKTPENELRNKEMLTVLCNSYTTSLLLAFDEDAVDDIITALTYWRDHVRR